MIDGISSVDIGTLLFDIDPAGELTKPAPAPGRWVPRPGPSETNLVAIEAATLNPLRSLRELAAGGMAKALRGAADAVVHSPWSGAASLAFALVRPRRELFFNRRIGPHRRVHHLAVELSRIKDVKNAFGGSVNDVILTIVARPSSSGWLSAGRRFPRPSVPSAPSPSATRAPATRWATRSRGCIAWP